MNDQYLNGDEYINGLEEAIQTAGFKSVLEYLEHAAAVSAPIRDAEMQALIDTAFDQVIDEMNQNLSEFDY